jgi:cell division protein FtsB
LLVDGFGFSYSNSELFLKGLLQKSSLFYLLTFFLQPHQVTSIHAKYGAAAVAKKDFQKKGMCMNLVRIYWLLVQEKLEWYYK